MDISARVLELAAGHNLHSGGSDSDRLPAALEYADRQWEQMVNAWCSRMFASAPARTFDLSSSPSTAQGSASSGLIRNSSRSENASGRSRTYTDSRSSATPGAAHKEASYKYGSGGDSGAAGVGSGCEGGAAGAGSGGDSGAAGVGSGGEGTAGVGSGSEGGAAGADSGCHAGADCRAGSAASGDKGTADDAAHNMMLDTISELAFSQEVKVVLGLQVLLDKDESKAGQRAELVETADRAARLMRVLPLDTSNGMRLIARTMSLGMIFYAAGKASDYGIYLRARGPEIDDAMNAALEDLRSTAQSNTDSIQGSDDAGGDSSADKNSAHSMTLARFELLCEIFAVWREMFSFSEKLDPSYLKNSHRTFNEHLKAAADLTEKCSDDQLRLRHALYLKVLASCRAATCALLDMEDSDEAASPEAADNEIDWDAVGNAFEESSGGWGPADMQHCAIAPGGDRELACSEFSKALTSIDRLEDHELEVTVRALRSMVKLA